MVPIGRSGPALELTGGRLHGRGIQIEEVRGLMVGHEEVSDFTAGRTQEFHLLTVKHVYPEVSKY